MPSPSTDRNLLFGILAVQMDFITKEALIQAMNAWVLDKAKPIGQILLDQKALAADTHELLEALVKKHLALHDNDADKSLAAVSSLGSLREAIKQVADPDLAASLAHAAAARLEDDPFATRDYSVGRPTSTGRRFQILRPHAKGGLGEVFVAEDNELHREVALKEIQNHHADDPHSRARFLLEAEITGGLEHPGIVPVYGLGQYADGRPFYAMRFIKGDNLKDAIAHFHKADSRERDPGERTLELRKLLRRFQDVCNAIAYAHSRGVLHRDLKPGNIMLGQYGETLVVDWGLAKTLHQDDPEESRLESPIRATLGSGSEPTKMGSAIGTPAFMSPEQAAGRLDLLGPASDVYSLGATLYSLLTGAAAFQGNDHGEILRNVQQGDFPAPRKVNAKVPAALEAICLKAMRLKPEDRYPTPRELTDDIEHWLADEKVAAWSEPWTVRASRWIRRHRTFVSTGTAAVAIAAIALTIATVLLTAANEREREAKTTAEQKRKEADSARERAEIAEADAKDKLALSTAVTEFLQNDLLGQAGSHAQGDRKFEPDPNLTIREALDRAAATVGDKFKDRPELEASIRKTVGDAYQEVGQYEKAIAQLNQSADILQARLGADNPHTLDTLDGLALVYRKAGKTTAAINLLENIRDLKVKFLGLDDPSTLTTLGELAVVYRITERLTEAIALLEQVRDGRVKKLGLNHPDTLTTFNVLGAAYRAAGKTTEAIALLENVRDSRLKNLIPDHPSVLTTLNNLASAYLANGQTTDAIALFEQVRDARLQKLVPDHPDTLIANNNLAAAYWKALQFDKSIPLFEQLLVAQGKKLGERNPHRLATMANLGVNYRDAGRLAEAIPLLEKAYTDGRKHASLSWVGGELVTTYILAGKTAEGSALVKENLETARKALPADSPQLAGALALNGLFLVQLKAWPDAEAVLRECLAIREKKEPDGWATFNTKSLLGAALLGQKKYADAEPLLLAGYEGMKKREDKIPPQGKIRLPEALDRLIELYTAMEKPDEVKKWQDAKAKLPKPVEMKAAEKK